MAYVNIPKDLTAVRTKFFMGLTKRQTICFGAAAVTGLPLFFLVKSVAPTSIAALIMIVVMLPWFLFAMYEKNGQPLEKYLKCVYAVMWGRPKIRTYQTDNLYAIIMRQIEFEKEVEPIVSDEKD